MMQKPDMPHTALAGNPHHTADGSDLPATDTQWFQIGESFRQQGRFAQAADAYRRVSSRAPEHATARHRLANTLKAVGLLGAAEDAYRDALALAPDNIEARRQLGNTLREQGRFNEAQEEYRRALALSPGNPTVLTQVGRAFLENDLPEEAARVLLPLVMEHPDEPGAALALAEALGGRAATSFDAALKRMAQRGVEVGAVIDVGAANGSWSRLARRHWPNAHCHMIEAFGHWKDELQRQCARSSGCSARIAAVGAQDGGRIAFSNDPDQPFGGAIVPADSAGAWTVDEITIDAEVARTGLPGPYLLKLDTHGAETAILEGAQETLTHCALVVIETYNVAAGGACPRFERMVSTMDGYGFRVIDLAEPLWRPTDGALWQVDFLFAPAGRPEFHRNGFF